MGALVVVALYLVVGGRTYCSWVCPINVIIDTAHRLRERLGLKYDRPKPAGISGSQKAENGPLRCQGVETRGVCWLDPIAHGRARAAVARLNRNLTGP